MTTDVEMPLVAPTPPPPSIPRPENRTQFGFRAPPPAKKPPPTPLKEVSLKPIALQFLKLQKNVQNLLQTCSEDSANGEIIETIKELKTTLKGFKTEFKKLPKINDIRDEQQQRIAELLKQIQIKDEFMDKLMGPSLIKTEPEDTSTAIKEPIQKSEEKLKNTKKKKKEKKNKSKAKQKTNSKGKSKDKAKNKEKDKKKKKTKTTEKPEKSVEPKLPAKPQKDAKETIPKKQKPKIAENIPIPKSKKKPPIEKRLVDPAKIKKLKEKIAEDKRKRADVKNAVAKINPEILSKLKNAAAIPKPSTSSKSEVKEKQKRVKPQQEKPSTKSTKPSKPEIQQTSQPKDQSSKNLSQKDKSTKEKPAQNQPPKDIQLKEGDKKKEAKTDEKLPPNNEAKPAEEVKINKPTEPPSPPIVKIMPLPGKKLRKPESPIKSVVTFGRSKPKEKKEQQKNPEEPLKSALKKPEGVVEKPKEKAVEEKENQNKEAQEKDKEVEKVDKVEKVEDNKPTTWKDLRQMYKKQKSKKVDKPDQAKNVNAPKATKPSKKLSQQHKLRKALKRLAKIQVRQEKRKKEEKKKADEKKKTEPTERMNIFKFFEDEKARKNGLKMIPTNAPQQTRIVRKVIRKPISRNEQILRKIRRNAVNNAHRGGHYTSPLLTVKYITELQNMIKNSEENGIPLSAADFRKLRFKYFPCKDSELHIDKLVPAIDKRSMPKDDIERLRKTNLVNVQNDINQQNSNITYPRNNPKTITDISMRLPKKDFGEEELDRTLYQELTNMGF